MFVSFNQFVKKWNIKFFQMIKKGKIQLKYDVNHNIKLINM